MDDRFSIGETKDAQLGRLLSLIAEDLDIPTELYAEMVRKYDHLGEWIRNDNEERFRTNSEIYPQGSVRLGTAIRPVNDDSGYDVDLVYRRDLSKTGVTQEQLVRETGKQLERYIEHRRSEGKDIPELERRRRCWAMNYDGRFHMDVLPAIPDEDGASFSKRLSETSILLTDRELHAWQQSNPKAYSDWFRERERVAFNIKRAEMATAGKVEVEQISDDTVKTPLRVAIQILKRHRDIRYSGPADDKPISIILTTLAAEAYNNETDVLAALDGISLRMNDFIGKVDGKWLIQNPVSDKENFADKWNDYPERAERFFEWQANLLSDIQRFKASIGLHNVAESMKVAFGANTVDRSIKRFGGAVDSSQLRGDLKMDAVKGAVSTSVGTQIPTNTWFGDENESD